ncbi:MAG: hypothetical protein JNL70_16005 [Saprospiraceae bacterium]|nr:hypothetical protein [Saprospiraceae bacterium]
MKKIQFNARFAVLTTLILVAALSRLLPHPPNATAMGAMALFGGAYFSNRFMSLFIPLATLFVSDLMLNNVVYAAFNNGQFVWFYDGAAWTYGSFAAAIVLSWFLLKKVDAKSVFIASLASSILFFFVTNFAAWQSIYMPYPKDFSGLAMSYTVALPFFANSIAGDLFFCAVLFGGFEWAQRRFPSLVQA